MPDVSKASYCVQHVVGQRLRGETKVLRREEVQPLDAFEHVDNFFCVEKFAEKKFSVCRDSLERVRPLD